jgi:hypothetical protein
MLIYSLNFLQNFIHAWLFLSVFSSWPPYAMQPKETAMSPPREYWMIRRGPGFLAVVWFGSSPTPLYPPLSSPCFLCSSVFLCVAGRAYWRERGGGKKYYREVAWSSINHQYSLSPPLCSFPGAVAFLSSRLIILNHPFSFLPKKMVAESTHRLLLLVLNTFLVISVKGIYWKGHTQFFCRLAWLHPVSSYPAWIGTAGRLYRLLHTERRKIWDRGKHRERKRTIWMLNVPKLSGWSFDQNSWRTLEEGEGGMFWG